MNKTKVAIWLCAAIVTTLGAADGGYTFRLADGEHQLHCCQIKQGDGEKDRCGGCFVADTKVLEEPCIVSLASSDVWHVLNDGEETDLYIFVLHLDPDVYLHARIDGIGNLIPEPQSAYKGSRRSVSGWKEVVFTNSVAYSTDSGRLGPFIRQVTKDEEHGTVLNNVASSSWLGSMFVAGWYTSIREALAAISKKRTRK